MASIYKTVRAAINSQIKTKIDMFRWVPSGDELGSRFRSSSCSGGGDKGDKQPVLGPSSGDSSNPGAPTMYDSRKLGHKLSTNDVCPNFETLPNIPTGVFRNTSGEVLGRDAGKCLYYQNPEYFSFHHMSFYDLNIALRKYRRPSPKSGRKPI
ncbi:uncharacterized protein LOC110374087 [Helicoverpa armigera]|uniref:uncharacterized protein LOC110374087 n=1 Tax=Helicoverpa armigera TaxID=29058 RepID=UPI000B38267A|nr:uncharacterized protein LOC110374087 [Helicoverpa armigera]XP_047020918.1 uncharacterized protein LOC124630916 [Helicoverpa zea]PZC80179.1 hypothetical protein B5X24_HaOG215270 [Helicoverpa armigera]